MSESQIPDFEIAALQDNKRDSLRFPVFTKDTIKKQDTVAAYKMTKSPTMALVYSALFPGLGQIYVGSYWKAPVIIAAAGALGYLVYWNNDKYQGFQKQYDDEKAIDPESYNLYTLKLKKEYYRDNRDQSAFYLVAVYLVAMVDSYVGAHLYDFNVTDDLSLAFVPNKSNGLNFSVSVKW